MKITIGMAHYEDFEGVWMTVENILSTNFWKNPHLPWNENPELEVIVVDNSPVDSTHSREVKNLLNHFHFARFIPHSGPASTTQPRQRIFDEATGDIVLVLDCHNLLANGAVNQLIEWFEANPNCGDIISGPMLYAWCAPFLNHKELPPCYETQFDPVWRSEMWGTWGCNEQGGNRDNPPFEIPGNGLGLFACLKKYWLGFNPHFRGFGGEELYIHTKFRQAGKKAICLPFLRWIHRYGRGTGSPTYPLTMWNKIRNYVLGFNELGLNLDPIYDHFVRQYPNATKEQMMELLWKERSLPKDMTEKQGIRELQQIYGSRKIAEGEWQYLIADPVNRITPKPTKTLRKIQAQPEMRDNVNNLEDLFAYFRSQKPRDLNEHFDFIRATASKCEIVAEFTKRRESSIAIAAGRPKKLISYQMEPDEVLSKLEIMAGETIFDWHLGLDSLGGELTQDVDMLFFDTEMSSQRLKRELALHGSKSKRYIIVTGTEAFGAQAEGEKAPGLWDAIHWWIKNNPEWFIANHFENQYGLTLLSKNPEDKPEHPVYLWPPKFGPGTNLMSLLKSVGIEDRPQCDCKAYAQKMDRWAIRGCEARFHDIVLHIQANAKKWGWDGITSLLKGAKEEGHLTTLDWLKVGWKSLTTGILFQVNPLDPFPGLVRLAIEQSKADPKKENHSEPETVGT